MTKPLISLSDLLAKAEAARPGPWEALKPPMQRGPHWYVNSRDEESAIAARVERRADAEFIAAASPDVVKALVEALNAASKWSMSPSTFLGRHGLKP